MGRSQCPLQAALLVPTGHILLHLESTSGLLRKLCVSVGICKNTPSSVSLFLHLALGLRLHLRSEGPSLRLPEQSFLSWLEPSDQGVVRVKRKFPVTPSRSGVGELGRGRGGSCLVLLQYVTACDLMWLFQVCLSHSQSSRLHSRHRRG